MAAMSSGGCDIAGFNQITNSQPLLVVDLKSDGSEGLLYSQMTVPMTLRSYGINGNAAIRDGSRWREVENSKTIFSMEKRTTYPFYGLKWTDGLGSLYEGRLMRVNLTWTKTNNQVVHVCVVFRVVGTLLYNLAVPSSPCSSGNPSLLTPSTVTVTRARPSNTKDCSKLSTIKNKIEVTKQIPSVVPSKSLRSSEVPSSSSSPDLPTEKGQSTGTESKKSHRNSSINSDNVLITIISAVAAVICVLIVSLFAWLIVRQRKRNRRNDESYGARVISNPAGSPVQNNVQLPVIKNPLYDENEPVYCDACDNQDNQPRQERKKQFVNPTYAETNAGATVIKNAGTVLKAHSPQKNINVQKELNDKGESGSALYQGLTSHKPANSTDDQPLYESLNSAESGQREFIYQPLITTKPVQSDESEDYLRLGDVIPDYLTLINPDEEKHWDNRRQGNKRPSQDSDIPTYTALENLPLPNKIASAGGDNEPDYDELEDPYETSSTSPTPSHNLKQFPASNIASFKI